MNLKHFAQDERVVSPVIGVILMVAITVILAAVIATFVLGVGSEQDATPQISLDFEYDESAGGSNTGDLTILVEGTSTEGFTANELGLRADDAALGGDASDGDTWDQVSGAGYNAGDEISAGDSITLSGVSDDIDLNVIWVEDGESEASILAEFDGPEA